MTQSAALISDYNTNDTTPVTRRVVRVQMLSQFYPASANIHAESVVMMVMVVMMMMEIGSRDDAEIAVVVMMVMMMMVVIELRHLHRLLFRSAGRETGVVRFQRD